MIDLLLRFVYENLQYCRIEISHILAMSEGFQITLVFCIIFVTKVNTTGVDEGKSTYFLRLLNAKGISVRLSEYNFLFIYSCPFLSSSSFFEVFLIK